MEIRELSARDDADLKDALRLVWAVFSEFEAPEYVPEGIAVFQEFISFDSIVKNAGAGNTSLMGQL